MWCYVCKMRLKNNFTYGILLGVLGIILFSSKAVMVKLVYKYDVDAISALLLRMLFSFPFYILIAYHYRNENKEIINTRNDYLWIFFFGFVGYYLASFFDFVGHTILSISTGKGHLRSAPSRCSPQANPGHLDFQLWAFETLV